MLEEPLVIEEIIEAIKMLHNGKSSVSDGLPIEIYKKYRRLLSPTLLSLYNEILQEKKVHLSACRGIITLIEKSGKDSRYISNWRPLSLLNTDYKILSKIIATRLHMVLPKLINPMQTGFMKGKNIVKSIHTLTSIIDYCNKTKTPAVIMSIDFVKVFDTIEWDAIKKILKRLNLEYFVSAIMTLYNDIYSCMINNGFSSEWFKITCGCRQGCCLSPLNYLVVTEVLGD